MNESARPVPHQIDAPALQQQLRRLAGRDEAPWLHAEVARRMAERLDFIKLKPSDYMEWAPSLGDSLAVLQSVYPEARAWWQEPTPALHQRAERRLQKPWWRKLLRSADPQLAQGGEAVQMLWANMSLHAAPDKPALLKTWHQLLAVDGFLMFSCLGPDSLVELVRLYESRGWGRPMPAWVDMHDLGDMMVEAGFADPVMDQERLRLTWSEPQKLLEDLRALGGNVSPSRFPGLRTRRWHEQLLRALESLRGPDGLITMSLELVYGHAFKPVPRPRVSGETHVSLDDMRSMVRRQGKD
ncbi:biotin synthase [Roseateles sp. DB2]|uniref:biotin synthase n=1 Tax=Roseateles sp. DB2 TaxID=3453717 RepID=UPI003EEB19E7